MESIKNSRWWQFSSFGRCSMPFGLEKRWQTVDVVLFGIVYIFLEAANGYYLFVFLGLPYVFYINPSKIPLKGKVTWVHVSMAVSFIEVWPLQGQGFDSLVVQMASFALFYLQRLKAARAKGRGTNKTKWTQTKGKWGESYNLDQFGSIDQFAAGKLDGVFMILSWLSISLPRFVFLLCGVVRKLQESIVWKAPKFTGVIYIRS